MPGHNIQAILIMERGGIPFFFLKLDPRAQDLDPMLVSGFFTALKSFSKEVIERSDRMFQVDYGTRLFTVISGDQTDLVVVSMGEWDSAVESVLLPLLEEFEQVWLKGLSRTQKDSLEINSCFPEFREGVVRDLSFRKMSGAWVPTLIGGTAASLGGFGRVATLIDGNNDIDSIVQKSGMDRDAVVSEISRLWAIGFIGFRNILEARDVLATSSRFDRLLQSSSPQRSELAHSKPEVLSLLPRITTLVDGRRTVDAVMATLLAQHPRQVVTEALEYLLDRKAIEALSPERRRILLVKEAMEIAVKVAETEYSKDAASKALEASISKVPIPEVVGDLADRGGDWTLNYDSRIYEGLNPRRTMELCGDWMRLLANYIAVLDKTRMRRYAEALTDAYASYLLERYTPDDLRGFEELAYWLETRCVED